MSQAVDQEAWNTEMRENPPTTLEIVMQGLF